MLRADREQLQNHCGISDSYAAECCAQTADKCNTAVEMCANRCGLSNSCVQMAVRRLSNRANKSAICGQNHCGIGNFYHCRVLRVDRQQESRSWKCAPNHCGISASGITGGCEQTANKRNSSSDLSAKSLWNKRFLRC